MLNKSENINNIKYKTNAEDAKHTWMFHSEQSNKRKLLTAKTLYCSTGTRY